MRQAGGLDDVEALQDGGLVGHQLPQEQLGLGNVALAHGRAVAGDAFEHASRYGEKRAQVVLNKKCESPKRFHARKKNTVALFIPPGPQSTILGAAGRRMVVSWGAIIIFICWVP